MAFTWESTGVGQSIQYSQIKEIYDNVNSVSEQIGVARFSWSIDFVNGLAVEGFIDDLNEFEELRSAIDYIDDNKDCSTDYGTVNDSNLVDNASYCSTVNSSLCGTYNSTQNSGYYTSKCGTDNTSDCGTNNSFNCSTDNSTQNSSYNTGECGTNNTGECGTNNTTQNSGYCPAELYTVNSSNCLDNAANCGTNNTTQNNSVHSSYSI